MASSIRRPALGLIRRNCFSRNLSGARAKGYNWYKIQKRKQAREAAQPDPDSLPPSHWLPENPTDQPRTRAYFEFSQLGKTLGTVEIELLSDLLPTTTENFVTLCKEKYSGTRVHAIVPDVGICAGDHVAHDGTGGCSALGEGEDKIFFEDEAFLMRHGRGTVTMLNQGVDTNNSQFCITTRTSPQLDGRNVAFGAVVEGMDIIEKMHDLYTFKMVPSDDIVISDCGVRE